MIEKKMITNNSSIGRAKEEEEAKNEGRSLPFTSSRQWSSFRNPRIVRVSRSFGGKDRHSKVCTVRGLRDRRIRLSVPTAVELYDLQDKLGLNQPSKVVDWLLDATKEDIDKLPPLQMPPGFGQFLHHQQVFGPTTSRNLIGDLLLPYESNPCQFPTNTSTLFSKQGLSINDDGKFWDMDSGLITRKNKQVMKNDIDEKGKGKGKGKSIELQKVSSAAQSFFPILGYSPASSTLPIPPYSSYNHYENSNLLSLSSQFGGLQPPQADNFFNPNSMSFPSSSSLALPSGLYLCPTTLPSLFPASYPTSYLMPPANEAADTRQVMNHFQLLNNAAAAAGPSQTSIMPASRFFQANVLNSKYLHHLYDNNRTQADKGSG